MNKRKKKASKERKEKGWEKRGKKGKKGKRKDRSSSPGSFLHRGQRPTKPWSRIHTHRRS